MWCWPNIAHASLDMQWCESWWNRNVEPRQSSCNYQEQENHGVCSNQEALKQDHSLWSCLMTSQMEMTAKDVDDSHAAWTVSTHCGDSWHARFISALPHSNIATRVIPTLIYNLSMKPLKWTLARPNSLRSSLQLVIMGSYCHVSRCLADSMSSSWCFRTTKVSKAHVMVGDNRYTTQSIQFLAKYLHMPIWTPSVSKKVVL